MLGLGWPIWPLQSVELAELVEMDQCPPGLPPRHSLAHCIHHFSSRFAQRRLWFLPQRSLHPRPSHRSVCSWSGDGPHPRGSLFRTLRASGGLYNQFRSLHHLKCRMCLGSQYHRVVHSTTAVRNGWVRRAESWWQQYRRHVSTGGTRQGTGSIFSRPYLWTCHGRCHGRFYRLWHWRLAVASVGDGHRVWGDYPRGDSLPARNVWAFLAHPEEEKGTKGRSQLLMPDWLWCWTQRTPTTLAESPGAAITNVAHLRIYEHLSIAVGPISCTIQSKSLSDAFQVSMAFCISTSLLSRFCSDPVPSTAFFPTAGPMAPLA